MLKAVTNILFFVNFVWFCINCTDQPYKQGAILYQNFCSNCHMDDGSGLENVIPPLNVKTFTGVEPGRVACSIRYGVKGTLLIEGKTYTGTMAAIPKLSDFEITNILNFMHHSWGDPANRRHISLKEVKTALEGCQKSQ